MGLLDSGVMAKKPANHNSAVAQAEAPEIPYVDWKSKSQCTGTRGNH